jgi:hypothetical protein
VATPSGFTSVTSSPNWVSPIAFVQ